MIADVEAGIVKRVIIKDMSRFGRDYLQVGIFFGTRFALEFMKNPQVAEEADMTFNIGQWLSVPLILLGAYLIATSRTRKE